MEIRTKFQLYQRVYPIEFDKSVKKWLTVPATLDDELCTINCFIIKQSNIYCSMELDIFNQNDCFETEKDAIKECDRRNGTI